jgi:hypothetical protein
MAMLFREIFGDVAANPPDLPLLADQHARTALLGLLRVGAVPVRVAQEVQFERPDFGVAPKRDFGISLLCASRPLIEFVLRHRAETTANIVLRPR